MQAVLTEALPARLHATVHLKQLELSPDSLSLSISLYTYIRNVAEVLEVERK